MTETETVKQWVKNSNGLTVRADLPILSCADEFGMDLTPPKPVMLMPDQGDYNQSPSGLWFKVPKMSWIDFDAMIQVNLMSQWMEYEKQWVHEMLYGKGASVLPSPAKVYPKLPEGSFSINIPKVSQATQIGSGMGGYFVPPVWGLYGGGEHPVFAELAELFPALRDHRSTCPACSDYTARLGNVIIHLNDLHEWSREDIADWLEILPIDLTAQPKKGDTDVQAEAA